jgi:hypothetical protein
MTSVRSAESIDLRRGEDVIRGELGIYWRVFASQGGVSDRILGSYSTTSGARSSLGSGYGVDL